MRRNINPYKTLFSAFDNLENNKEFGKLEGKIQTWRDPYCVGYSTTYAKNITFQPGVTVLVGCNGAGKTTLINNIKDSCHKAHVAYMYFNNLHDGGSNAMEAALYHDDTSLFANLWSASEGESISANIGTFIREIGGLMCKDYSKAEEIWLLFDATDSGLSVDNVIEVKEFFSFLIDREKDKTFYIIISANEYELASGQNCLDVISGKPIAFKDYNEYRNYIIKSREKKDNRINKALEKQKQKDDEPTE